MSDKQVAIEALLPFYALGTLTDEERARVDEYVANNPEAKKELAQMTAAAHQLPLAVDPIPPTPQVKADLMARVQANIQQENLNRYRTPVVATGRVPQSRGWARWRLSSVMPLVTGLAMVLLVIVGVWGLNRQAEVNRLNAELATLQADITDLSNRNEFLRANLQQRNLLITHLADGSATLVYVAGTETQPAAQAWLITPQDGAATMLMTLHLTPLPEGEVYQFWLIKGDTPLGAGVFDVNSSGQGWLNIEESLQDFDAMGVSIEPEGGSTQPTGNIVLLGDL